MDKDMLLVVETTVNATLHKHGWKLSQRALEIFRAVLARDGCVMLVGPSEGGNALEAFERQNATEDSIWFEMAGVEDVELTVEVRQAVEAALQGGEQEPLGEL